MSIDRYRSFIPQWDRFVETIRRPEPTTLRVRPSRIGRDELARRLADQGFVTEPVPGLPEFLRVVDGPHSVALTLEHWLGLFYVQQTVTGVAAPVLGVGAGDRVLDMCASPGGKTTHLADRMGDGGCLVAADVNEGRLKGLMGNLTRLLIPNVVAVVADGRRFPGGATFDRILVDAPCSAEGNLRKKLGRLRRQKPSFRRHVARLQEKILRRAIELVRPGGPVLYVTCTFAPEENEAVLTRVLADAPVRIEPVELPVPSSPGLTAFEGTSFHPTLEMAHRLYPHHLDSGGLFMALLRKDGGDGAEADLEGWSPVPATYPGDPLSADQASTWVADGLERLIGQFGVDPSALQGLHWMVRSENAWMHTCDAWPVEAWEPDGWRVSSVGLRGLTPDARDRPRPTNYLLRRLGPAVQERVVELSGEVAVRALKREEVSVPPMDPGYATLKVGGSVVGRASVGRSGIRHEIPKARAQDLLKVLETAAPTPRQN